MKKLIFVFIIAILSSAVFAETIRGTVLKINDGDTFIMRNGDKAYTCRIWGIDTPEMAQDWGYTARSALWQLIKNKHVTCDVVDKDAYGRHIVKVTYGGKDIGLELLKGGLAWWYKYYAPDATEYQKAFEESQKAKRLIFSDPKAVPPWDFRHRKKKISLK